MQHSARLVTHLHGRLCAKIAATTIAEMSMSRKPAAPPPLPAPPLAHLVIHASAAPAGRSVWTAPLAWLDWLRGLAMAATPACPLRLHIDDLQGQRVFTADDAGPALDLDLPAGTYQVTALLGPHCRGYTLTLVEGVPNELYLCSSLCGGGGKTQAKIQQK
jgi:hypothetical protein